MSKKQWVGIIIFIVLILVIIGIKFINTNVAPSRLTTIYVATGGGKEDFISDERILKILKNKYKIEVVYDSWSNGKTVTKPLIREAVNLGNQRCK